ncbi:MAG: tRNA uridine-5-carboxymethylaminomethyl(34) synthesis GTPase MnmE [Erysipelotrichales bacterium]|nr:tRNA uridine-5-carboxymethylaminomethyl(34) synthesis GTPase MnmE [Erysipelotrichales bacterium]
MTDNICAISTALGAGAISIVRCSGQDVVEIVNKLFKGNDLTKVQSHTINYGFIVDKEEVIDEVLVSVMLEPNTFTCENIVEINCHGGIATTNKVLELLLTNGCRLAEPGEFTKRAFLNGRIDLVEAEGVNDLIFAETEESRKFAINRVEGNLSNLIKKLRESLVSMRAEFEVNFDYPEESDAPEVTHKMVIEELTKIKTKLEDLLNTSKDGEIIKNGINIAIIGRPNVGKSSILNHLLDQEKAIVTNIAGTTRDIVEGTITLDGIKVNLIDTAGIRDTEDIVEKIGVDKSINFFNKADLVIYVLNNNEEIYEKELSLINDNSVEKIIFINKNDLESNIDITKLQNQNIIYGNTVTEKGLDNLKEEIKRLFNFDKLKSNNYNLLANARQTALVKKAINAINNAVESTKNEVPLEMIAVDIDDAFNSLGEIIGETYKDELLDELFSKFCLGK